MATFIEGVSPNFWILPDGGRREMGRKGEEEAGDEGGRRDG